MQYKEKLIIIEGTRGAGKSTITNWLRENVSYSQLFRLTGTADKSPSGLAKISKARKADLDFCKALEGCNLHLIYDRYFLTEHIYADKLSYKEFTFLEQTHSLCKELNELDYDKYLINLYVGDRNVLADRIGLRKVKGKARFHDIEYSLDESMGQQKAYRDAFDELKEQHYLDNVKLLHLDTSKGFDSYINEVIDFLEIGELLKSSK